MASFIRTKPKVQNDDSKSQTTMAAPETTTTMTSTTTTSGTMMTWEQLADFGGPEPDKVNGPTNAQSYLRLFGRPESEVEVTFYRDLFAWCPYCQKVWLFLEEKKIPYRVRKVTMFCYGTKEDWYKRLVPSGMLPALSIASVNAGSIITESDVILAALEARFGSLHPTHTFESSDVVRMRRLERRLFGAWCEWLCRPARDVADESSRARRFADVAREVEEAMDATEGPFALDDFSIADVVFVPYVERMRASLYYYKGYDVCALHPRIARWFDALWGRETYAGTASDFFTHVHDLPPQMGGCYVSVDGAGGAEMRRAVNRGPWISLPQTTTTTTTVGVDEDGDVRREVVRRCVRHRRAIVAVNSDTDKDRVEIALRSVLTRIATSQSTAPPKGSALALRHLRDQVSVPRDMGVRAGSVLRQTLEDVAALDGDVQPPALPTRHRRDQDARPFMPAMI